MAGGFDPKSLDDILAGAPGRRARGYGWDPERGPKPLWAVLGQEAPFGWEATATRALPESDAGTLFKLAASGGPGQGTLEPVGPEACAEHYPPWSPEWIMCQLAGDNPYFDCVRACVIEKLPEGWDPSNIDRTDPAWWDWLLQVHPECFQQCESR